MIKGCSRRVIVVKDPGSSLFEEAYFIVSPKESERKHGDFLMEANRIIRSKTVPESSGKRKRSGILQLVLGFVAGVCISVPTVYFLF